MLLVIPLSVIATGIAVVFLARAYFAVADIETSWDVRMMIRVHIVLHIVPFAYLMARQLTAPSLMADMLWLAPLSGFFYTGRHTWRCLFKLYQAKLYYIFYRGNTGLLVMMPVLITLGVLFRNAELFSRVLGIYSTIHFLLIGLSVLKIENDISAARSLGRIPPA